jgi:hypothetical protein
MSVKAVLAPSDWRIVLAVGDCLSIVVTTPVALETVRVTPPIVAVKLCPAVESVAVIANVEVFPTVVAVADEAEIETASVYVKPTIPVIFPETSTISRDSYSVVTPSIVSVVP